MSHSFEKRYSSRSSYLNKKRFQESNHISSKEHSDNYKYNYKPFKPNYYYNQNRSNFYKNTSKNYYFNRYQNNAYKNEYKRPFNINFIEGVRNISNCEMQSPQSASISINENIEENSLKSISDSTNFTSPYKPHYHQKENQEQINHKGVGDFKPSPNGRGQDFEEKKDVEKKHDLGDKLLNKKPQYEIFDRNSIEICQNPVENFIVYPENIFELKSNTEIILKNYNTESTSLKLDSCYLLSKIPNWRLVSKFVPISSLKAEKFQKILDSSKKGHKHSGDLSGKNNEDEKKTHLVYSEKYENLVEDLIEENRNKKKEIKKDIFNRKSIINNFHYDALSIRNKIKQHKYEIDCLNIKGEELEKVIEAN